MKFFRHPPTRKDKNGKDIPGEREATNNVATIPVQRHMATAYDNDGEVA